MAYAAEVEAMGNRFHEFKSRKIVKAAKIKTVYSASCVGLEEDGCSFVFDPAGKPTPAVGWYVIAYNDGYVSFLPPHQFTPEQYVLHTNL